MLGKWPASQKSSVQAPARNEHFVNIFLNASARIGPNLKVDKFSGFPRAILLLDERASPQKLDIF